MGCICDTAAMKHDPQIILNIIGHLVSLGPPRSELVPLYQRWRNDFAAMRQLGDLEPITAEQELARYERLPDEPSTVRFTIYDRATLQPIGSTALDDVDFRHRTAEYSILIGEPAFRNRGYGTETTRLMLDYAFTVLGLHNILLRVFAFNPAGQRAYQKAGFREIGRRHASQQMGGRLWDAIYMDCLASEFDSPIIGRIFVPDELRQT